MTPRVVRFDDVAEPEQAAPVARFGEGLPEQPDAGDAGQPGMFDRLHAPAAAPVASVGHQGDATSPAAAVAEVADIANVADIAGAPAPVFRAAELTGLAPGGRGRRGSADPKPAGRSPQRRTPAAPAAAEEPAATSEPRQRGRSADRGARRGGGGFGSRGRPAELDPDADPIAVAREVCLRLLADRARTRQELAQALARKGVPDEAANTVLERFDEVGLIDDAAFAGQWVRSRHNHRGLARRAIAMELRRKGVDDEVAGEALEEVDQESEERRARELVDRKLRTVPADTPEQRKKAATRLVGMLARKGYGGGIAYRVVREALAAHGAEIDELGTDPVD